MKKNDDRKRYEIQKIVEDCLEANYQDIGGGDTIFLPIAALEDIIAACQKLLDTYEIKFDDPEFAPGEETEDE